MMDVRQLKFAVCVPGLQQSRDNTRLFHACLLNPVFFRAQEYGKETESDM